MATEPTAPAPPAKPRRRWNQFSLRTLLIVVTLLALPCAWVAREARIVAERKAWLDAHPHAAVFAVEPPAVTWPSPIPRDPQQFPSTLRRWLGDKPVARIYVTENEENSAVALFPEANTMPAARQGERVEAWLMRAIQWPKSPSPE